ncbi:hypothetical protein ACJ73_06704 [Blastomyces percursus]|uniref:Methyltransferase domain-containing protein n=1 Tax=Blastomyces percursus TaxID=1658174 RepID=A0A1J9Q1H0_9EURO|nr:hypothetical protein ACJ73_06704 [Blastomyces percursus]
MSSKSKKNTNSFPGACRELLDRVLQTAGLDDGDSTRVGANDDTIVASATGVDCLARTNSRSTHTSLRREGNTDKKTAKSGVRRVILDVGFGCGEQTLYLARKKVAVRQAHGCSGEAARLISPDDNGEKEDRETILRDKNTRAGSAVHPPPETTPLFHHYIGITLEKTQCAFAQSRVVEAARNCNTSVDKDSGSSQDWGETRKQPIGGVIELFCGDAAKPHAWSEEIQRSISTAFRKGEYAEEGVKDDVGKNPAEERYVLGLDTLYHFSPSRQELFEFSYSTLQATILAFDLFLPPKSHSSSPLDTIKRSLNTFALRCLTPALSAPYSNFVTIVEYKCLLEKAGYGPEDITIEDITEDVFPGLAQFFGERIQEMSALGLKGFTKWRVSEWLFRWLASGQVLRAGIVVAKWKGSPLGTI